jgi:hypothetical protein
LSTTSEVIADAETNDALSNADALTTLLAAAGVADAAASLVLARSDWGPSAADAESVAASETTDTLRDVHAPRSAQSCAAPAQVDQDKNSAVYQLIIPPGWSDSTKIMSVISIASYSQPHQLDSTI